MEDLETTEVEVEENITPEVVETSEEVIEESDLEETTDEGEHEEGTEEAETSEDPAYEPNFSFRAGEEEYEMDDRLKAYIKNEDDETYLRDLAERAHGLDTLKDQRQHLRQQNQQFESIEAQRQGAVTQLQEHINKNEWEPFQKTWNITDDAVLNRAVQIMQLREMPPEQQQAYYNNVQAQEQNQVLQQQNQQLQQQQNQYSVQRRDDELNQTIQHENFSQAAQTFDERAGRPGAFRDEIIRRGQYYAQVHGKDLPPHVLAQELSTYVGAPQQQQQQQGNQQGGQRVIMTRKPTLPKISGSGASPVKGGINSIADIKARAQEFASG
jgi:hypothetical protein